MTLRASKFKKRPGLCGIKDRTIRIRRDRLDGSNLEVRRKNVAQLSLRGSQCANHTRNKMVSALKAWGIRLAKLSELRQAKVAVARSSRSFCIGRASMVPNLDGRQRRSPCKQHNKLANSADHRRDPRSLSGRWSWCDRPWLCDAQKASALLTLIRQRHPAPSCRGPAPTAEKAMNPARMCLESLAAGLELEHSQGRMPTFVGAATQACFKNHLLCLFGL